MIIYLLESDCSIWLRSVFYFLTNELVRNTMRLEGKINIELDRDFEKIGFRLFAVFLQVACYLQDICRLFAGCLQDVCWLLVGGFQIIFMWFSGSSLVLRHFDLDTRLE